MKPVSSNELRAIQLNILKVVADFCDNNDITYFLAFGTLIGAIRHHGYIPWDDDIDIAMPRPDYDRFLSMFDEEHPNFKIISIENNYDYGFSFAKVHDNRTIINETQYKQDEFGVYIDIFPIDGIKYHKQVHILRIINKLLHTKKANFTQRTISKKIINALGKIILLPFSTHFILTIIDHIARQCPFGSTSKAGCICDSVVGERAIVDTDLFSSSIIQEFEGESFKIPVGYDKWLKSIYGDYMQLPPLEKRISHHVFEAYWKEPVCKNTTKSHQTTSSIAP